MFSTSELVNLGLGEMYHEFQSQLLMLGANCPKFSEVRRQEPLAEVLLLILVVVSMHKETGNFPDN